jgi:Domain of unknown function (DUF1876)
MNANRRWTVEILIDEHDGRTTTARARLDTHDDLHVHGHGNAQRRPVDIGRPDMCDHLAVADALSELAAKITRRARRTSEADHA